VAGFVPDVVVVTPLTVLVEVHVVKPPFVFEVVPVVFLSHSSPNSDDQKLLGWQFFGFVVVLLVGVG
jgi:hypothetical protein